LIVLLCTVINYNNLNPFCLVKIQLNKMAFNQQFIEVLDKLRGYYQTKGNFMKGRAYEKARDSLILHKTDITSVDQLQGIPNVGKSTIGKLKEYVETKSVKVLDDALNDPEIVFSNVYGIGPKKRKN
jgi:DNA polymerase/3'-5' exonuclease PolX